MLVCENIIAPMSVEKNEAGAGSRSWEDDIVDTHVSCVIRVV